MNFFFVLKTDGTGSSSSHSTVTRGYLFNFVSIYAGWSTEPSLLSETSAMEWLISLAKLELSKLGVYKGTDAPKVKSVSFLLLSAALRRMLSMCSSSMLRALTVKL